MTAKTKERNNEASRISKLQSAYRKHQAAIQNALELRARSVTKPIVIAAAPDGTQYKIGCGPRGYMVLGVEQGRRSA